MSMSLALHPRAMIARRAFPLILALALSVATTTPAASTSPTVPTDSFTFRPVADTFVDSTYATTAYGGALYGWVDASPTKQIFLRFDVAGIDGRSVRNVRLRLYNTDGSASGGRIQSTSGDWDEGTAWSARPSLTGPFLGLFSSVSPNRWYEVDLGALISSDGVVSLGLSSGHSDGARWATRESAFPPQLIVDLDPQPGLVIDGSSVIAAPTEGSSDPTYHSGNHRLALSEAGRLLAVHGRHSQGVQMAWRDSGGGWQTATTGIVSDGLLLRGTKSGDWPASIVTGRDSNGVEHAWVVWSRASFSRIEPVRIARVADLDASSGPSAGATAILDAPARGSARPDIAIERRADGVDRAAVSWIRRTEDTSYEVVVGWLSGLDTDSPVLTDEKVLLSTTSSTRTATLEPAPDGLRLTVKNSGRLVVYRHLASDPPTTWTAGTSGITVGTASHPAAVVLPSGETVVAVENDTTNHIVSIQRFSRTGAPASVELRLTGYQQPTVATDGARMWLIAVRSSDGRVVSREWASGAWTSEDRVELGPEVGSNYAYPNALRHDSRLRLIVRGPHGAGSGSTSQNAVLAYQRTVP